MSGFDTGGPPSPTISAAKPSGPNVWARRFGRHDHATGNINITNNGDSVTIGGAVTHHAVSESGDVPPALAALAGGIGDPAVRHRGTIGGSVANNGPSACYPSACLGLGATIHTSGGDIGKLRIRTPTASWIALAIAGGAPTVGDSATPLAPSGW